MNVNYDLVVDFVRPNKSNTILIAEGDNNSRRLRFVLLSNKLPFDMIDVTRAQVSGVKPDGSIFIADADIMTDDDGNNINEVEYTLPREVALIAGKCTLTITLCSNSGQAITSFEFYVQTRNALYNEDDYIKDEDLNGFRDLLNRSTAALEKMETMTKMDALPCPYPINVFKDGEIYSYSGIEKVDIDLKHLPYIDDEIRPLEEAIDETAAASAAESARRAEEAAKTAVDKAAEVIISSEELDEAVTKAKTEADRAELFAGQARVSANIASEADILFNQFKGDMAKVTQNVNRDIDNLENRVDVAESNVSGLTSDVTRIESNLNNYVSNAAESASDAESSAESAEQSAISAARSAQQAASGAGGNKLDYTRNTLSLMRDDDVLSQVTIEGGSGGSNEWVGTHAEYEAIKDTIPDGYFVTFTDDADPMESYAIVNSAAEVLINDEDDVIAGAKAVKDFQTYSTDEHIVGKWIDGKTLYEKTFVHTNVNISANSYVLLPIGAIVETVFIKDLPMAVIGTSIGVLPLVHPSDIGYQANITLYPNDGSSNANSVRISAGNWGRQFAKVTYTLRYTKA